MSDRSDEAHWYCKCGSVGVSFPRWVLDIGVPMEQCSECHTFVSAVDTSPEVKEHAQSHPETPS